MDFASRGPEFQRRAAAVQNRKGMDGTDSILGPLPDEMQSRIGFDVLLGTVSHQRINVCREVSRKIDNDVSGAGSKLRRAFEVHRSVSCRSGINPGGDASTGGRGLHGAR